MRPERRLPGLLAAVLLLQAGTVFAGRLEGLERVDPELIRNFVEPVTAGAPAAEISATIEQLYGLGYFRRVDVLRQNGELVWQLEERPFVREIQRVGLDSLSDDKIDKAIRIRSGVFLDPGAVRTTRLELERLYRDEGQAETEVAIRTEPLGPGGDVRVVIEARETGKIRIVEVRIGGNADFADAEILTHLESQPPSLMGMLSGRGTYDREAAERDRFRVEAFYLQRGYLKVQVDGPSVSFTADGRRVLIEYQVREGLPYDLGRIDFEGDIFFRRATLRDWIAINDGEPLNRIALEDGIRGIVEAYSEYGFAFARVEPEFIYDEARQIADVRIRISRGPLVYVRRIDVVGNTKTRDKVVRRELLIGEGELFSGRAVRQSRERVFALGFFENVTFETDAVAEDQLDLRIRVVERATGTASAGIGYSSIDRFVGNLRLNFGNLAGYGIRLDLQAEFGRSRQTFSVSFTDPYFLDSPFSLGVDLFRSRQEFFSSMAGLQSYTQSNLGGRLSLGYKIGIFNRVFLSFRDELTEFENLQLSSDRFFTGGETRSLTLTWRRDARNHPFDPTDGNLALASAEAAGYALGGDHTFTKYRVLGQQFFGFAKDLMSLMFKAEFGLATAPGQRVPFAERYFVGGIFTLRGYDYRAVGPSIMIPVNARDPYSDVTRVFVGGNKQALFSTELLFPILPPAGIKGVLFVDAGNTWLEEEPFFASTLRIGYGFGFRWFSPIGPLRFEWGFPVDRQPNERPRVFEFSIGSYF